MVASTIFGVIRGRVADRQLFWIAVLGSIAGNVGIALWHGGIGPAAIAAALTGIGIGFSFPIIFKAALARVDQQLHAHSIGLVTTASYFGAFSGPILLGPVMRTFGADIVFALCAIAWLVVGGFTLWRMGSAFDRERSAFQSA